MRKATTAATMARAAAATAATEFFAASKPGTRRKRPAPGCSFAREKGANKKMPKIFKKVLTRSPGLGIINSVANHGGQMAR